VAVDVGGRVIFRIAAGLKDIGLITGIVLGFGWGITGIGHRPMIGILVFFLSRS